MAAQPDYHLPDPKIAIFISFLLLGACASKSFLVGGGAQTPALAKLSDSPDASAALFAPLYYPVGARIQSRGANWSGYVSADLNPYPVISPERGVHQFHSQIRFGLSPRFASIGPFKGFLVSSAHLNWQRGLGKTVLLGNGESTSTFYTPSSNRLSQNLNLGTEFTIALNEKWLMAHGVLVEAPFSNSRRQYSAYIALWYKWRGAPL